MQPLIRSFCHIRLSCSLRTETFSLTRGYCEAMPQLEPEPPGSHESPTFLYDPVAAKFINCMMWDGKKNLSVQIFRNALARVKEVQLKKVADGKTVDTDPLKIFHKALENLRPTIGTRRIRRGARMYQVPMPLTEKRRSFLAMKWLIVASRDKEGEKNARMYQKLAGEILDAYHNQGNAMRKKLDLHKQVAANRAYASFRWR